MARALEPEFVGRTYDDFLFRPQASPLGSRREVSLRTRLTRRLTLDLPVVSANMDSVTDARMAVAMALEGGLGFVHRGLPIAAQAAEVARVKRTQGHLVDRPFCLARGSSVREARELARRHNVTGLLVEEAPGSGILAGLLSNRDLPWSAAHDDRPVEEFMTPAPRLVTGAPDISIEDAERRMFAHRVEKLPLVDGDGRIKGLITKKDILAARQRPHSSKDARGRLLVGAAIGARGDFLERAGEVLEAGADALLIDIAHAHSEVMRHAVEAVRGRFGGVDLVLGNVATAEGAMFLRDLGADAIKVGVGPGRGCRTRLETGAGVPQLQAIREAWCAVEESVPIIADGGVREDKDVFLALVAGASVVMLGSLLSGTDESPGQLIEDPGTGEKRKIYRGMTSPQAVFRALYDDEEPEAVEAALEVPAEGQEMQVPYRGSVVDILRRIRGHVRSAVSYGGAESLAQVRAKVLADPLRYLVPLSSAARAESYER
ncbi:MAG TPA: IMP dehydrogenase [Methylomirabilota bacterium]|nr:IMP dehydrogenase [Methylomirabilota bacterium]